MPAQSPTFNRFVGVDVAKHTVTLFDTLSGTSRQCPNTGPELRRVLKDFDASTLVVCETTGGYEHVLLDELTALGLPAHRADAARVKAFLRSLRRHGKTDAIDAKGLAHYARERAESLPLWVSPDTRRHKLQNLAARRQELVNLRVAETNRSKAPQAAECAASFEAVIAVLNQQIKQIGQQIEQILLSCQTLTQTATTLRSIPGIGPIIATELIATMPELGHMSGKQAAALAGLAPHPRDSGTLRGKRSISGGRHAIRSLLFMAALSAARSDGPLGLFYSHLIKRGKIKMVALTALARKIIVIANAKIRDQFSTKQS